MTSNGLSARSRQPTSRSPVAAFSLIGLAVDRAIIGDIDEARSDIRRGASILRELGMTLELAAAAGLSSAVVEMMAGDYGAAEAADPSRVRDARRDGREGPFVEPCRRYPRADDISWVATTRRWSWRTRPTLSRRSTTWSRRFWLHGVRAKVLARRGRFDEAEREARENARLAEETDWPGYTGMAWTDLAEVLHLAGRATDAAAAARRARDSSRRKGASSCWIGSERSGRRIEAGRAQG